MTAFKTIIVDKNSEQLAALLRESDEIQLIGEFTSGSEAINAINAQKPDLVFLEIEMPEIDGFEIIEHLEKETFPFIVFTSSIGDYAAEAFEVDALDYIQKPFGKDRLNKSINRIKKRILNGLSEEHREHIGDVIQNSKSSKNLDRFIIKQHGEYYLIRSNDIIWIESDGNYSRIMTTDKKFMVRYTLTGFKEQLDAEKFYRISRSQIVNIDFVVKIKDYVYGNYIIELESGKTLKMSKNYKNLLETLRNF